MATHLLDKGELFKLIHGALKKKPQKLLFDAVWADVSCNDAREVSVKCVARMVDFWWVVSKSKSQFTWFIALRALSANFALLGLIKNRNISLHFC